MSPQSRVSLFVIAAALAQTACVSTLHRTPDGNYAVDGPNYRIAALPDGRLMPEGWVLVNYEEKNGQFSRADRYDKHDLVMRREVDDGLLNIAPGSSSCHWSGNGSTCVVELSALGQTVLSAYRVHFIGRRTRDLSFQGGAGTELLMDAVAANGNTVAHIYEFAFHDQADKRRTRLVFVGDTATFAAGAKDVAELVKRI